MGVFSFMHTGRVSLHKIFFWWYNRAYDKKRDLQKRKWLVYKKGYTMITIKKERPKRATQ